MSDFDRLEQLNRLREAGALTDEEFATAKGKLLSVATGRKRSTISWWLMACALLFILVVGSLYTWNGQPNISQEAPVAGVATGVVARLSEQDERVEGKVEVLDAQLAFATSTSVLGVSPAFMEKQLGAPREKHDSVLVFEVGGCTVNYSVQDNQVKSFYLTVTRTCQPIVHGLIIGPSTTFGQLMQRDPSGKFVASCLTSCGNAADPTIDLTYPAAHANQFITVSFSTDYQQASNALELWEKAVRRRLGLGEFDTPDDFEAFSCNPNPPAEIMAGLRRMTVRAIYVSGDEGPDC